jgi:tetratricopeptide (TPR) repeat protein
MSFRIVLGAGAAIALTAAGAWVVRPGPVEVPRLLDPALLAASLCGGDNGPSRQRALFIGAASAYAQDIPAASGAVRLPAGTLARVGFGVATSSEEAQSWFNQGLAFSFGFNHREAVAAFRRAQEIDAGCAMCHWGEAYALGSNINAGMTAEDGVAAREALDRALALEADLPEREAGLIDALSQRFVRADDGTVSEDAPAFADAMEALSRRHPDTDFIAVVAAEANMTTQPWDYWEIDGRTPRGRTARTIELIETVLARSPDYAPAIHLYIHITEASSDPWRAESHADRLASLTPELGHLVHMPSHTYYRIGEWRKARDHNVGAVEIDAAYVATADSSPLYAYGYYPHNIHFALTSALMAGDAETALDMADRLREALPAEMAELQPWIVVIRAAPYYAAVRFSPPETLLELELPEAASVFERAAWHYARGEALARSGDVAGALAEADEIAALTGDEAIAAMDEAFVSASEVLAISELTVRARAAAAGGDLAAAIGLAEDAAAIQLRMGYMEPPWWYYPSRQTLAGYLMRDGQLDRAEQLLRASLIEAPNNAYAYYGLAELYRLRGDRPSRRYTQTLFDRAWMGARRDRPTLETL